MLYKLDLPYNLFPSLHVSLSTLTLLIILPLIKNKMIIILITIWWASMTMSVIFIRQHHISDIAGGILLAWITVSVLNATGLNMSQFSQGMEALGYPSLIYPSVDFASYVKITLMVMLTGVLAAIYPALHAIRLKPAEAIRKE